MMRFVLMSTVCMATLAIAGCSKSENNRSSFNSTDSIARPDTSYRAAPPTSEAFAPAADVAPGVNVTAAPGVAFNYAYAFRLPADTIKDAQEAHAQACEKLGVAHCRITGMHYRVNGENDIQGALEFKLDPGLARAFGKQGIDAVVKAKGKLVNAEITGTDAGSTIVRLQKEKGQADTELQRIDRQLTRTDLKTDERAALQNQRTALVARIAENRDAASDQVESLANTPMTFEYASGPAVQGFDGSAPITSAGNIFIDSATVTIGVVLTFLAALAPPGLVLLVVFLIWRRFRPRKAAAPAA